MKIQPATPNALRLFHEGSIALAQVEANGIHVDVPYLNQTIAKTDLLIRELEAKLKADPIWVTWRKCYGERTTLGSREQFGGVFFGKLKYPCERLTHGGVTGKRRPVVDEEAFETIDHPFAKDYAKLEKYRKARGTYLEGIRRELSGELIHPSFSLAGGGAKDEDKGGARSYRGSCNSPNLQNLPARNPEIVELVKKCFIPRKGHQAGETDFKGVEVGISVCYNKDPTLIAYISDPSKDMHRDAAMDVFMLEKEEVSKDARYVAKNRFVFPQFYGSYYPLCAKDLWDAIGRMKLKRQTDGISIKKHLRKKGIKRLGACDPKQRPEQGTFEDHVKKVEGILWNERFPVYTQWKKDWWQQYQERGWFELYTGFICHGYYRRNQVLNWAVQGAAFHCLLQCLIWLQNWLTKYKMRSLIVNQVHDSIWLDMHHKESDDVLGQLKYFMTEKLPSAWPWIIVPLSVESEIAPINASWFDKKSIELR